MFHGLLLVSQSYVVLQIVKLTRQPQNNDTIETALVNSVESDLGRISRIYFDNGMLTSQKPCQYNNKFEYSETNGYKILQLKS